MSQNNNDLKSRKQRRLLTVIIPLIAAAVGFGLVALFMSRQNEEPAASSAPAASQTVATPVAQPTPIAESPRATPIPERAAGDSAISSIFGIDDQPAVPGQTPEESWRVTVPRILFRLILAAIFATVLAFRPRKDLPLLQRNPYVAQTQILLAVVAS